MAQMVDVAIVLSRNMAGAIYIYHVVTKRAGHLAADQRSQVGRQDHCFGGEGPAGRRLAEDLRVLERPRDRQEGQE